MEEGPWRQLQVQALLENPDGHYRPIGGVSHLQGLPMKQGPAWRAGRAVHLGERVPLAEMRDESDDGNRGDETGCTGDDDANHACVLEIGVSRLPGHRSSRDGFQSFGCVLIG